MDIHVDVVVVGAGGGGGVLGLALAGKGVRTLVLERSPGPPQGVRGEILQPNGQKILDDLGLLTRLPSEAVCPVRHIHFRQVGGGRLCSIDYDDLPPPYNRALVTLPHAVHREVLDELATRNPDGLWYGASFVDVVKRDGRVVGVVAEADGKPLRIAAKLVVGADGPFSKVRDALGIPTAVHRYADSYLVAVLDCPDQPEAARYFLGTRELFGVFPAGKAQVYLTYMVRADAMDALRAAGVESLRARWAAIDPELAAAFRGFQTWEQSACLPAGRTRAATWVADGAALIGDAAHGMNPHASQGRMQAMADAVALAELAPSCLADDDFSATALRAYETRRRPAVEMLQRLADEEVVFWNTGNPLIAWLRNRVFRTIDRNRRLKYRMVAVKAGLRETAPFDGMMDRLQAAGMLPDSRAEEMPPHVRV